MWNREPYNVMDVNLPLMMNNMIKRRSSVYVIPIVNVLLVYK